MVTATTNKETTADFFTMKEFSEHFRISVPHAYTLVNEGHIGAVRLGGAIRIPASEVKRLTEEARPKRNGNG